MTHSRASTWRLRAARTFIQGRARSDLLFTMSDNTHRPGGPDRVRNHCFWTSTRPEQPACAARMPATSRRSRQRIAITSSVDARPPAGGARRDRTDDLLLAKQALSQLSYGPVGARTSDGRGQSDFRPSDSDASVELVGLGRFELPTSRLSSARSNQLSYKPSPGISDQSPEQRPTGMRRASDATDPDH